jgi:uncharacterized membrane protein YphA (DoxX/SURF4 family)
MMYGIKQYLEHPVLVLLLRVLLGSVFVISGLDKIADMNVFVHAILHYQFVGTGVAMLVATILPWLEILCGLGLILGIYPRPSSFIITVLLLMFTVLVGSAMIRGLDISCGCFTQDPSANKIDWQKIAENVGMILIGIYLLSVKNWKFVLENNRRLIKHP